MTNSFNALPDGNVGVNFTERLLASSFYPVFLDGPLCPFLNDPDILFRLLGTGELRKRFKKFTKLREWPGKPKVPNVMSEDSLKSLLYSACNSPKARSAMGEFDKGIQLGYITYKVVSTLDCALHQFCQDKFNQAKRNGSKENVLTPKMFHKVIEHHAADEQHREALHFLALALAMVKQQQAVDYIGELLRVFPESATSMGCRDENGPDCATSSQSIDNATIDQLPQSTIREVSCLLSRTDELVEHLRELQSSFVEYQTASNQIGMDYDINAFFTAGQNKWLKALNRTHEIIAKSGTAIVAILAKECQRPDGHECEFVREQEKFRKCRPSQVNDLIAFAERALGAVNSVAEQEKSTRAALQKEVSLKREYLRQLGRTDEHADTVMEKELPCVASVSLSRLRRSVQELKVEFDSMLKKARIDLESRFDAIERTEGGDVSSKSVHIKDQVAEIRRKLHMADDLQTLEDCRSQIDTLETLLRDVSVEADSRNLFKAASRLQENRVDTLAFLDLCGALRSQGKPKVALLALITRQNLYPADEISEDPDRAIGELVEVVCQIGNAEHNFHEIWHSVSNSPWLSAIARRDFATTDLIERLAVMYAAEGAWGNDEQASISLLNLGVIDCSDLALPTSVNAIIKAIVSRTPIRIANSADTFRKEELRQAVEERIATQNGKYRHIQCVKTTHFARFEAIQVFPELEELWSRVSSAITNERHRDAIDIVRSKDADRWFDSMFKFLVVGLQH